MNDFEKLRMHVYDIGAVEIRVMETAEKDYFRPVNDGQGTYYVAHPETYQKLKDLLKQSNDSISYSVKGAV